MRMSLVGVKFMLLRIIQGYIPFGAMGMDTQRITRNINHNQ